MPFAISDEHLPAILRAAPMTDDEFTALCAEHPDLMFEMTADGDLIVMAPTHSLTGYQGCRIIAKLFDWAEQDSRGVACDSSTGFVLPNGARRSPEASWTLISRIDQLDPQIQDGFWHLSPDFVIELKSKSDSIKALDIKMQEYIANGSQLGWLIVPENRSVTIYRAEGQTETRTDIQLIAGEGIIAGFMLDLAAIWNPREPRRAGSSITNPDRANR